jgi:hypothetical protein
MVLSEFVRRLKVSRVSAVIVIKQIVLFCHTGFTSQKKQKLPRHLIGSPGTWFVGVMDINASLPPMLTRLMRGLPPGGLALSSESINALRSATVSSAFAGLSVPIFHKIS